MNGSRLRWFIWGGDLSTKSFHLISWCWNYGYQ